MVKRLLSLFVVVALLVSCTNIQWSTPPISVPQDQAGHIFVCVDLPQNQWSDANEAIKRWDMSLHQWKHVEAMDGATPVADTCTVWVHQVDHVDPDDDLALAWTSRLGGHEISMRKGHYEQDVTGILMHELGHAFGAQHVPGTLMNSKWYPHEWDCPDVTTVAQVAAWNQVSLEILSYCTQ